VIDVLLAHARAKACFDLDYAEEMEKRAALPLSKRGGHEQS
jgi:hypothetical protein